MTLSSFSFVFSEVVAEKGKVAGVITCDVIATANVFKCARLPPSLLSSVLPYSSAIACNKL